jgi:hypothetical protein
LCRADSLSCGGLQKKDTMAEDLIIYPLVGLGLLLFITVLFEYLWNTTMPQVFNLKLITFWQAFRLLLIGSLLTGGFIHYNFGH